MYMISDCITKPIAIKGQEKGQKIITLLENQIIEFLL